MNSRARTTAILILLVCACSPLLADWDEGVAAFNAGRYQDAAASFRAVVEASPEAPAGYYMLGLSLLRQKQASAALEPLAKAVELGPDDPRNRLTYAQAQLQAGKADDAVATLASQDVAKVPASARKAYGQLAAQAATRSTNHRLALQTLEKVAKADGSSKTLLLALAQVARKAGRPERAFAAYTNAYELDRGDQELARDVVHVAFAEAQKQNGDAQRGWYSKGFEAARKWAETSRAAEAYLMAGQAQMGLKDYAAARDWFAKAAGVDEKDPQPHYEQARCDLALKEAKAALAHLKEARDRSSDPELTRQIFMAEGFAYRHLEDFVQAAEAFRKANNREKAAEMDHLQELKEQNALFEKEKKECQRKVAEVEKLKKEMVDLKGTDAWEQLEADYQAILEACKTHLSDGK